MQDYDLVRQLVQILLKTEQNPTKVIIHQKVKETVSGLSYSQKRSVKIDEDKLVRELESKYR